MQAGFAVLAFDFRNQGESDRLPGYDPRHWLTEYEVADVLAAVDYVAQRDDLKQLPLGLMGISRGGGAALAAAVRLPQVRCVSGEGVWDVIDLLSYFVLRWASLYVPEWVLKPVPKWHFLLTFLTVTRISGFRRKCRYTRLKALVHKLRDRQVLLVAGSHDSYVPSRISQMLFAHRFAKGRVLGGQQGQAQQIPPRESGGLRSSAGRVFLGVEPGGRLGPQPQPG